jgi:hypothetical protein
MSDDGKRISQLNQATIGAKDGKLAVLNATSNKTEKVSQQTMLGAIKASFAWQADMPYSIDDLVESNSLVWKSKVNSNLGNVPSENSFWTNEPISAADGITDTQWAAGVFTFNDSKVVFQNAQYFLQISAPYISSDIAAEIAVGDWKAGVTGATGITDVTTATYTVITTDQILNVLRTSTGVATITIPTTMINAGFNKLVIKDAGGNAGINNITVVGEGGELIDGQPNLIIIGNYSSVNLYATNSLISIY